MAGFPTKMSDVFIWRQVVAVTGSPGAHAMSPAAATIGACAPATAAGHRIATAASTAPAAVRLPLLTQPG